MRPGLALGSVLLLLAAGTVAAVPGRAAPLPERMGDTGGGSQLITAVAARPGATTGRVTWWDRRRDGRWVAAGSAAARFGAKGLVEGARRKQSTSTTPTGLYDLPYAFGIKAVPAGTRYAYRTVTKRSWWCQDNRARTYNRWVEGLPADCRAAESEHLVSYATQYARALVIGFNYHRPVRGRGAGIFLHVNGRGATAGCVSVPDADMGRILAWADQRRDPHIAIGTSGGPTAITRY
ncbi:L,D-transpeptidase family protein [Streptomyces lunaelactis]|uniref:L,D-transpeptidase family protein n=1 Tax=Streptomyces lunaelactis TaxID=1535768 RepID=UPI001584A9C6|nr:L,D-transpeptidase family protein [Streptomyces lunaelactis]NUK08335.1 L,D-transpeptidase family protein [Streptomyces lunaelactis]NUK56100.1 L,D-transpeptidase family protein [Streptomyces lunaelactis]NUL10811.1 L,D-transpeptidase family protein [Streptomyces lunaelactis]